MKHVLSLIFVLSLISVLLVLAEAIKVSTVTPVPDELYETKDVIYDVSKHSVYLEDVVYTLKSYNWSKQEELCLNQTLFWIRALQNFTLWAVWNWDSIASEPQGLLYGSRYQLGNFDECLRSPWHRNHQILRTQYCLADIVLERIDDAVKTRYQNIIRPEGSVLDYIEARPLHSRPLNELTWGVCVPASCGPGSVERLLATMLARSHLSSAGMRARIKVGEDCQKQDEPVVYNSLFWAFIVFVAVVTAAALLGTYLNSRRDKTKPKTLKDDIIEAFCVKENAKNLLIMRKDGVEVLYGIRFLTISFIVLFHQLGIFNSGAISDGLRIDQDVMSIAGLFLLHDDLFVDTFFFISGFFTATSFNKLKKFPNPLVFILRRYVRLIIAFAVIIFFICAVYPYTGSGPLWPRGIAADADQCRKNWWLSLLMLNNYIDSENICIVISWYIPCDFHYFCVAVLLYWLYRRCPRLACAGATIITILAIILPGVINYVYDMPAVQLFNYEFVSNPRASQHFHLTYIKSHTRAGAYIVGFISGFIFFKSYSENSPKISKKWSILGAITGLVVMLVVMLMGTTFIWRTYHPLEGAIYAALNRPIWTCGVAMLVLCCALGHVPLVTGVLSWYPWVPLSRLSYGLYLTHALLISRNVFTTRNSQDNDYPELLITAVGVVACGCVLALVIWLLTEAPATKLLALMLREPLNRISKEATGDKLPDTRHTSIDSLPSSSKGHLQDNLPTTVTFSSKV